MVKGFKFSKQHRVQREWFPDIRLLSSSGQLSFEFLIAVLFVLLIFVYSMTIFQERLTNNIISSQKWNAQNTADTFARTISKVYLMDNNSVFSDNFYWATSDQHIDLGANVVRAWWDTGSYSSSPFVAEVDWQITDVNGLIFFKKINGEVVVSYD